MINLLAAMTVLTSLGHCGGSTIGVSASDCRATYIEASDEPITIHASFATWTIQAILIGCGKDLATVDASDRSKVVEVFRAVFTESDLHLLAGLKTRPFRGELVKRINKALGRLVLSDIAFLVASRAENVGD